MAFPTRPAALAAAVAAAVLLAAACDRARTAPAIGFSYNWGDESFAQFLREEIERTRPEGGAVIRLINVDSGGWQALGASALAAEVRRARTLADDPDVVVAVGPGGSREALLVAPVYREVSLMDLVPTATSRLLEPMSEWSPVLAPNDSLQGEFIGQFADSALKAKRVAIFYVPDEYGIGLASGTAAAIERRGARVVLQTPMRLTLDCIVPNNDSMYRTLVDQAEARLAPDVAVIAARTVEAACLTRILRDRWPRLPIIAGDGTLPIKNFFDRAGSRTDGVHIVEFWHLDPTSQAALDFVQRFERAVDRPLRHADVVYFDATILAATAIRQGGATREGTRRYLRSLGAERPPYQGLSGPIAFTPGFPRPILMIRLDGGRSTVVAGR